MAEPRPVQLEDMLRRIDAALASNRALSAERIADVRRLRAELVSAYKAGRIEEARRCEILALALVKDAPQSPGGADGGPLCFVP